MEEEYGGVQSTDNGFSRVLIAIHSICSIARSQSFMLKPAMHVVDTLTHCQLISINIRRHL